MTINGKDIKITCPPAYNLRESDHITKLGDFFFYVTRRNYHPLPIVLSLIYAPLEYQFLIGGYLIEINGEPITPESLANYKKEQLTIMYQFTSRWLVDCR